MQRTVIPKNSIWEVSDDECFHAKIRKQRAINLQSYLVRLLKIFKDSSPWEKKMGEQRNEIVAFIRGLP